MNPARKSEHDDARHTGNPVLAGPLSGEETGLEVKLGELAAKKGKK